MKNMSVWFVAAVVGCISGLVSGCIAGGNSRIVSGQAAEAPRNNGDSAPTAQKLIRANCIELVADDGCLLGRLGTTRRVLPGNRVQYEASLIFAAWDLGAIPNRYGGAEISFRYIPGDTGIGERGERHGGGGIDLIDFANGRRTALGPAGISISENRVADSKYPEVFDRMKIDARSIGVDGKYHEFFLGSSDYEKMTSLKLGSIYDTGRIHLTVPSAGDGGQEGKVAPRVTVLGSDGTTVKAEWPAK